MKEFKIKRKPFFYDAQIKRYLSQICAAFAGYTVKTGKQRDGKERDLDIPVILSTYDRVVSYLSSGGNMNVSLSVPCLSVEVAGLRQKPENSRAPYFTDVTSYKERVPQASYEGNMAIESGNDSNSYDSKMVERHMPVAYELKVDVILWASNYDQAFQFVERMGPEFNGGLDVQLSNSILDWTYISILKFDGDFDFRKTVRDMGSGGGEDDWHLVDMSFSIVIHLSPPAKVYSSQAIEEIHTNIRQYNETLAETDWSAQDLIDGFIIRSE